MSAMAWAKVRLCLFIGVMLVSGGCSSGSKPELVGSAAQATDVDEETNCFTSEDCGLYRCDSEHACNTSCARDSDCIPSAHCDQDTCTPNDGGGDGGTGCGLYASDGEGCYPDCRNDSMCVENAYCFQSSVCKLNHCYGLNVDDNQVCTYDTCNFDTGVISHTPFVVGTGCPDDNLCNGFETCNSAGNCISGTPVSVSDGDPCTADSCEPTTGEVTNTPLTPEMLDDHNPCTTDSCNPTSGPSHIAVVQGSACDDQNTCNGHETCNASGQCLAGTPPANGTSCSRGNLCFADTCQSGSCTAGSAVLIADANSCTLDTCTPSEGVKHRNCSSLDRTVSTVLPDAAAFLYTGNDPVQVNAASFLIDPTRLAVVRGHVLDRSSAPLPGVKVSVPQHPSWGSTVSQGNGDFDLVVNGGQNVRLRFELDPYLAVERTVVAPVQDYVTAADVVMTAPDPQVTTVDLSGTQSGYQVARGSVSSDSSGTRRATLLVPPGVQGNLILPDSSSQPLSSMHFRATEYSVGTTGPKALPSTLPGRAAYAYAVSLAADEARVAQASRVEFSQPLSFYVENFLGFSVGTSVPFGFNESATGAWVPSSKGVVLKVLSVTGGQATVDFTGDNQADSGSSIGLGAGELQQLASLYSAGQTLWRVQLGHFTDEGGGWPANTNPANTTPDCPPVRCMIGGVDVPCTSGTPVYQCSPSGFNCTGSCGPGTNAVGGGCNGGPYELTCCPNGYSDAGCGNARGICWLNGYNANAKPSCDYPPPPAPDDGNGPGDCDKPHASTIRCQRQSLGEDIAIAGTPYSLHYESDRQLGRKAQLRIPITSDRPPAGLQGVDLQVSVAGRVFSSTFTAVANQSTLFTSWDGKDVYGRLLQGSQPATVELGNRFASTYGKSDVFGLISDGSSSGITTRQPISVTKSWKGNLEFWDAKPAGLGGWSLNVNHVYDISGRVLRLGDGKNRSLTYIPPIIRTFAGTGAGGTTGSGGGQATTAVLSSPTSVAFGPDGRTYIADGNACVRMVYPTGAIITFAGNCSLAGFAGDGGPATSARLQNPTDLAVDPSGAVYIADSQNHRIRRVTPDGIINTIVGSGPTGSSAGSFAGDGGDSLQARLNNPTGIDLASDGVLYIADSSNARIRSVGRDGIIRTVAGGGAASPGNDGAATAAVLSPPTRVRYRPDGSLFIAEPAAHVVRRIGPDGIIRAFAGNTQAGYFGDGGVAKAAMLNQPMDVAVRGDGAVLILDKNNTVRLVVPSGTISTVAGIAAGTVSTGDNGLAAAATFGSSTGIRVAPDGDIYLACTNDNRVRRIGPALRGFTSPSELIEFASEDGKTVNSFDGRGRHMQTSDALTGAVLLQFAYDGAGRLTSVTDFDNNVTHFDHDTNGHPTLIRAPFGQETALTVDTNNYLATATDPEGNLTSFTYDTNGLMLTKTDPNSGLATYTYDTEGRLKTDQDTAGGKTTLTRTNSTSGFGISSSTRLGLTSTYQTATSASGAFSRSNAGPNQLTQSLGFTPDGTTTTSAVDGTLTISKQLPDPRFGMLAPTRSITTKLPSGLTRAQSLVRTVARSGGNVTSLTETTTLNGKTWTRVFNVGTRTWTSTSPLNRQTTLVVDAAGRDKDFTISGITTRSTHFDSHGRVDLVSQGVRNDVFSYFNTQDDSNGYLASTADALSQQTTFTRDGLGRMLTEITDGATTAYGWDGLSNMASLTPPGQPAHGLSYTPVSLLSEYTPPVLASVTAPQTTYSYDYDRKLTNITRPDGVTLNYGYDTAGRLSTVTTPAGIVTTNYYDSTNCSTGCAKGKPRQILNPAHGVTVGFSYDGTLPKALTWSGNVAGSVSWLYDANFRKTDETISGTSGSSLVAKFGYDDDGLLTCASPSACSPTPGTGSLTLTRDAGSGRLSATAVGSLTTALTYNAFGELATDTATYYQIPFDETYDSTAHPRDALGRVQKQVEMVENTFTITNRDYEYDSHGRLWKVKDGVTGTLLRTYAYDGNGNRSSLTTSSGTVSASYDDQDRLESYGNYSYSYTYNGELRTKTDTTTNALTTYAYDAFGNLTKVELPNSDIIEYIVDGQNRRVAKKKNGTIVKRWLYQDQLHPVAELNADGTIAKQFIYASGKNSPDLMIEPGTVYGTTVHRILSDQLGSPRLVINMSTNSRARMRHDEFGNVLEDSVSALMPFGFAGGLYDPDTGLVRFGARDYDPVVGRWISKDPIRFDGGQANLYVYVNNDPINASDRSGTGPFDIAECRHEGNSWSECWSREKRALCENWGIACPDDAPAPAAAPTDPTDPTGPTDPTDPGTCEEPNDDCVDKCLRYIGKGARYFGSDGFVHRNDRRGNKQYAFQRCYDECRGHI